MARKDKVRIRDRVRYRLLIIKVMGRAMWWRLLKAMETAMPLRLQQHMALVMCVVTYMWVLPNTSGGYHTVNLVMFGFWVGMFLVSSIYEGLRYGANRKAASNRRSAGALKVTGAGSGAGTRSARSYHSLRASAAARIKRGKVEMWEGEELEVVQSPVPILAKRIVKIDPMSLNLTSVFQGGKLKRVMRARCSHGPKLAGQFTHGKIPAITCECGFYALTIDNDGSNSYASGGHIAEVELGGRIIECGNETVTSRKVILLPRGEAAEHLGTDPIPLMGPADLLLPQFADLESPAFEAKLLEEKEFSVLGYRAQYQTLLKVYVDYSVLEKEVITSGSPYGTVLHWPETLLDRLRLNNPGIEFVWYEEGKGPYKG